MDQAFLRIVIHGMGTDKDKAKLKLQREDTRPFFNVDQAYNLARPIPQFNPDLTLNSANQNLLHTKSSFLHFSINY
jgi:hypothetical protein